MRFRPKDSVPTGRSRRRREADLTQIRGAVEPTRSGGRLEVQRELRCEIRRELRPTGHCGEERLDELASRIVELAGRRSDW